MAQNIKFFEEEKNKEEFSTLLNIINGDIQYEGVTQIAKKFRKPDMKLLSNIKALSPSNRKISLSPRSENASPRTKIQNLMSQNLKAKVESQKDQMETQMRMSTTKLNFNKKTIIGGDSPQNNSANVKQEKSSQNSFFRRIFCLSPQVQSPRKIQNDNDTTELIEQFKKSGQIIIDDTVQRNKEINVNGSPKQSPRIIERRSNNRENSPNKPLQTNQSKQESNSNIITTQDSPSQPLQQYVETLSIPQDTSNNTISQNADNFEQQVKIAKSSSQLQLKMNPTEIIQSSSEDPFQKHLTKNKSEEQIDEFIDPAVLENISKSDIQIQKQDKDGLIKKLSPKKELWKKLEKTIKSQENAEIRSSPIEKQSKIKKIRLKAPIPALKTNDSTTKIQLSPQKSPVNITKSPKPKQELKQYNEQNLNESLNLHFILNQKIKQKTSFLNKNKPSQDKQQLLQESSRLDFTNNEYTNTETQSFDYTSSEKNNQSFTINNSVTSRNLLTKVKPTIKSKSILDNKVRNYGKSSLYDDTSSISSPARNYMTYDSTSRKSSQSVEPSAKQARMKIQRILDEQKAQKNLSLIKLVNNMETKLFHKSSTDKQIRSKSVLKTKTALPYKQVKQLPDISQRLNFSSLGGGLDMMTDSFTDSQSVYQTNRNNTKNYQQSQNEQDDITLQSALERYLTQSKQDSIILSNNSSKNRITNNQTLENSLQNSSEISPQDSIDPDFQSKIKELQKEGAFNNRDISQKFNNQPQVTVSVVSLMMKHQIFKKMQKSSVKSIINNTCQLMLLKKGQVLFKEEDESKEIYLVIYGCLGVWNKKNGNLGRVIPGFTAGEECLIDPNYVCRFDNCYAEQESCVFSIEKDSWNNYKRNIDPKESVLLKDVAMLEGIFNRNFIIKKGWKNGGISKIMTGKKSFQMSMSNHINIANNKVE